MWVERRRKRVCLLFAMAIAIVIVLRVLHQHQHDVRYDDVINDGTVLDAEYLDFDDIE